MRVSLCLCYNFKKILERLGAKTHKYLKMRANANIPAMPRYANQVPLFNFEFLEIIYKKTYYF